MTFFFSSCKSARFIIRAIQVLFKFCVFWGGRNAAFYAVCSFRFPSASVVVSVVSVARQTARHTLLVINICGLP